jgi:hypothetical protein
MLQFLFRELLDNTSKVFFPLEYINDLPRFLEGFCVRPADGLPPEFHLQHDCHRLRAPITASTGLNMTRGSTHVASADRPISEVEHQYTFG